MSSVATHPRSWWNRHPKSPKPVDALDFVSTEKPPSNAAHEKSAVMSLNSIAVAIGLRPRKQSTASRESRQPTSRPQLPLPAPVSTTPRPPAQYTNRPPALSVSTVGTSDDRHEPLTPLDADRGTCARSVLTMSDIDPFASSGIAMPQELTVKHSSLLSDTPRRKYPDVPVSASYDRSSYTSSALSQRPSMDSMRMSAHKRQSSVQSSRIDELLDAIGPIGTFADQTRFGKSVSTTTLTGNRTDASRPRVRASTVSTTRRPPPPPLARLATIETSSNGRPLARTSSATPSSRSPSSSPSISRRPSQMLRKPLPPATAPPIQTLPTLPVPPQLSIDVNAASPLMGMSLSPTRSPTNGPSPASPSPITFAKPSPKSTAPQPPSAHEQSRRSSKGSSRGPFQDIVPNLRRALSQESVRSQTFSLVSVAASASGSPEDGKPRTLRKQRSFHNSGFKFTNAGVATQGDSLLSKTEVRPSTATPAPQGRKRLFSGSSMKRPTTSPGISPTDNHKSMAAVSAGPPQITQERSSDSGVLSLDSFQQSYRESAGSSTSVPKFDGTPRQIVSDKQLQAIIAPFSQQNHDEEEHQGRDDSSSLQTSTRTMRSYSLTNPAPPTSPLAEGTHTRNPNPSGTRPWTADHQHDMLRQGSVAVPILRHAVSQGSVGNLLDAVGMSVPSVRFADKATHPSSSRRTSRRTSDAPSFLRTSSQSSATDSATDLSSSILASSSYTRNSPPPGFATLPPPPRPKRSDSALPSGRTSTVPAFALSPPPRRVMKRVSSPTLADNAVPHRNMSRKSSFLVLDDDFPSDNDEKATDSSFLDLTRPSMDTIGSANEDELIL